MSVKSRINKIEQVRDSVRLVLDTNKQRFILAVRGSDPADNYQMIVETIKEGKAKTDKGQVNFATIQLTCNLVDAKSPNGWTKCNGQHSWLCYHSLGAFLAVCQNTELFDTYNQAMKELLDKNEELELIKLRGTIIKLVSSQNQAVAWAIIPPILSQQEKYQIEIKEVAKNDPHLAAQLARRVNGHKSQIKNFPERVNAMRGPTEEGID